MVSEDATQARPARLLSAGGGKKDEKDLLPNTQQVEE